MTKFDEVVAKIVKIYPTKGEQWATDQLRRCIDNTEVDENSKEQMNNLYQAMFE